MLEPAVLFSLLCEAKYAAHVGLSAILRRSWVARPDRPPQRHRFLPLSSDAWGFRERAVRTGMANNGSSHDAYELKSTTLRSGQGYFGTLKGLIGPIAFSPPSFFFSGDSRMISFSRTQPSSWRTSFSCALELVLRD